MRQLIFEMIEQSLLNRSSYFTREQEIQIYLSRIFENSGVFDQIFYRINFQLT